MAHLRIPANAGDAFAFPYSASYAHASLIDVRVDVALDAWQQTAIAEQNLMAIWGPGPPNISWGLYSYQHSRSLRMWIWNGSANEIKTSTAALGASAGERLQVRAVANATAGTLDFYTRDPDLGLGLLSDTSWSALGAQIAIVTNPFIIHAGGELTFGADGPLYNARKVTGGNWFGGYIRTGGTTEALDVDFSDVSTWVYA